MATPRKNQLYGLVVICFAVVIVTVIGTSRRDNSYAAVVTAKPADALIESMGVAAHLRYYNQTTFDTIFSPRLGEMGIRYIRDGGKDAAFFNNLNTLAVKYGIKSTLVMDPRDGIDPNQAAAQVILPTIGSVVAVEGPNEWDVNGGLLYEGQNFPNGVRLFQQRLYAAVKNHSDARVRSVQVLTPSMANPINSSKLGSVPCDMGNMHSYSGSVNLPDDQLDTKWIPNTLLLCPGKRIVVSEAGYCNDTTASGCSNQGGISRRALAKYAPRHYLENFNRGVYRDHIYNLSLDNWSAFLETNGSPKPAFYAVKNFISLVQDKGNDSNFIPASLGYSLSGSTANLKHTLFQKKDGRFYLMLWLNVKSSPGSGSQADIETQQNVTVTFDSPVANAKVYLPTFNGLTPVSAQTVSTNTLNVTVPDHVLIIELNGNTAAAPTPAPAPAPVTNIPDLVVTAVNQQPVSPVTGSPVTFSAVVKNQGTGATPAGTVVGVSYQVNGQVVSWSDTTTTSLPAGASITLTANNGPAGSATWVATAGTNSVTAVVDDVNRIAESVETNNTFTSSLIVGSNTAPAPTPTSPPTTTSSVVKLIGVGSKCLDVKQALVTSGTPVQLWTCSPVLNQNFERTSTGELRAQHATNKCLDVDRNLTLDGTRVQIWECNGSQNQIWSPTATGEVRSQNGRCLDVNGGLTADGTVVQLWTCNGSTAQKWTLQTVASTVPIVPGDANNDGRVNALDLSLLLSNDGKSYPPGDFSGDGIIGAADLAILLSKWTW